MIPFLGSAWTLLAGVLVLLLPGLAWMALFWDPDLDAFERLAEVLGIGIASTAVLALLAFLVGGQLGSTSLILVYLVLAIPAIWTLRRWWQGRNWGQNLPFQPAESFEENTGVSARIFQRLNQVQGKLIYLVLAVVLLLVLVWRFYQIREVVLPLWVDSVHHVQIVVMFLENGGIPESFAPTMPVPFYYHYAFHSIAAVFSFFTRLDPSQAVLYLGQVLNAAIALGVYRLGKALWGGWRRALISAILVAFVTQMPAYYVTWGRYTLLTGVLLLTITMATALDIINKGCQKSRLFTLGLLTAGILLSHYFAAALLAIFLVILTVQEIVSNVRQGVRPLWSHWLSLLLGALGGLLLASPWLVRMWGFAQGGVEVVAIEPNLEAVEDLYFPDYFTYLWRLLGPDRNQILLFAAIPGLFISLFRERTRAFGAWAIILSLISLPLGFYVAPFRPDHAVIVLFLPTALLIADLMVTLIDWRPLEKILIPKQAIVMLIFALLVSWGIFETTNVVNSATVLVTRDDLQALNWLDEHVSRDAHFGINVAHWQFGSYRGVDGGWWITPLTGRTAILPSALSGMGDREYSQQVNSLASQFNQLNGCNQEFWQLVRGEGITHLYISEGKGALQPGQFEECPGVELIFENSSVFLYQIEYIIEPGD